MTRITALAALVAATLATPLAARQLDPQEARIAAWVDAHSDEAVALTRRLVNINSGTMNHDGVRAVGNILQDELDQLGFRTEWIDMSEVNRAGHLVAARDGDRGRKMLLIGHLDTVFEKDDPFQEWQEQEGGWVTGPGTDDMKSGDVVIVYALKALEAAGALDGTQVRVVYSGDEERPGKPLSVSRRDLIEAGRWADVALGFEDGYRDDQAEWATTARRGSSEWSLEVTGQQAHSSQIFTDQVGAGAIFEAARILGEFYDEVRGEEYLTFNAGSIVGGTDVDFDYEATRGSAFGKTNVVPRKVVVQGGIRTISDEQLRRAQDAMRAVVAKHLPHTSAEIHFEEGYPGMAPTDGNRALQGMLSEVNQALGRKPMPALDPSKRGAADISFVAPYTDGLAGMGAYGANGHTPQERLDVTSFPIAIKRAAILIYRLANAKPVS